MKWRIINARDRYSIDFSPLMTYMDKSSKRQEPKETYQEDSLKVLTQLNEEKDKELYAVVNSVEFLEDETKCRILERIADFAQDDEEIRNLAISKIFALTNDKLMLYEKNEHIFQNNSMLIRAMINYLLDDTSVILGKYELVRDFIKSISVTIGDQDDSEQIAYKGMELVQELLWQSFDERQNGEITNTELEARAQFMCGLTLTFLESISDPQKNRKYTAEMNGILEAISIYCEIEKI